MEMNYGRVPEKKDMCEVDIHQVIGIKPDYKWNVRLKIHKAIDDAVNNASLTNYHGNW